MTTTNMTIRIGGAAGDGVESSGVGFCQALGRGGLHVFGLPDYYSRIRGGHNFFSIRVSDQPLYSHQEPVHLLLALTEETIPRHRDKIVEGGAIVYDSGQVQDLPLHEKAQDLPLREKGILALPIPLSDMAKEKAGTELARNTLALGVAAGLTGFDLEPMESVIRQNFARKGQKVVDGNLAVVEAGYQEGRKYAADFPFKLERNPDAPPRMVLNGTEAFSLGALAGGCRFVAGYPMTPGSLVLHWMAAHSARYGVVLKHTEDEIAAINMAIGAAHMGARALVPTSGGGFALMVEALGLAGMTETPVVIYNAQRPGPSTGLPTRQEQGDLLFMLYASQGEFPRFLVAPGTHEECFVAGWRVFNLAEKYQTPALVLSDHYLAVAIRTLELDAFDFEAVEIDRGELLSEAELDGLATTNGGEYLRYRVTDSGVSPRAVPGHPKAVYVAAGNEHDESGAITEEPEMRTAQVEKRQRKLVGMGGEMSGPLRYGPPQAEVTFVSWGSTYGPLREAVDRLNAEDYNGQGKFNEREGAGRANLLHFVDLWPFPTEAVMAALESARRVVSIEVNATAQLATLIRSQTGREMDGTILKYDGRAFTPDYIVGQFGAED
ncbi:MAG: 2-oxoacid:acceptor oxidoreductase subunit alpha [Anaerolineae bacterium]|nr:2-oxoacid:acceptor oxidoreductase subunit alpha [Anaerolineae bacterium]